MSRSCALVDLTVCVIGTCWSRPYSALRSKRYHPDATVPAIAASLSWGLIKNHAFIDGNKRIGLVAAVVLLKLNGYRLTASAEEQIAEVRRVAASESNEDEWTAWVERNAILIAG